MDYKPTSAADCPNNAAGCFCEGDGCALAKEPEAPKGAMYGQSDCPNAPNACYCTGACQRPVVRAIDQWDSNPTCATERLKKRQHLPITDDIRKAIQDALNKEASGAAKPSFVEEHNQQKHVNTQQEARDKANELAEELLWRKHGIVSAKPEDYYNGTATLDNMIAAYGKEAVRSWAVITCHKYLERMGKKAGNSLEQERTKALWYLATAERLYKELQAELA